MELPQHIKVIIWDGHWSRQDVIDNPDKLFLFGGNFLQDTLQTYPTIPSKTQAVIRRLDNAFAINTKWTNGTADNAYLRDIDFVDFKEYLRKVNLHLSYSWSIYNILVLPSRENGIGTGTAFLETKAPKCWKLLQEFLAPLYERANQEENGTG